MIMGFFLVRPIPLQTNKDRPHSDLEDPRDVVSSRLAQDNSSHTPLLGDFDDNSNSDGEAGEQGPYCVQHTTAADAGTVLPPYASRQDVDHTTLDLNPS